MGSVVAAGHVTTPCLLAGGAKVIPGRLEREITIRGDGIPQELAIAHRWR